MSAQDPLDESASKKLSQEEICQLPKSERLRYLGRIRIFYPLWHTITNEIRRCHQLHPVAAEPECLLLVGPAGAGKTTLLASYTQDYPAIFTDTATLRPVVMATTPSRANVNNLETALLTALGDPAADKGSIGSREIRLTKYFKEICRVELLILDELQHFWDRQSKTILHDASNWLKTFIKETKVSCALVGLPGEAEAIVNTNPQLASLFGDPYILSPFTWDETEPASTRDEFCTFLAELEERLPLKKPSHLASYETALRCFAASDGILRYLMALIRRATYLALEREQEYLDQNLLFQAFKDRLAGERRGIPNPFTDKLPDLEEIKKNKTKKQELGGMQGTNNRSRPRDPDSPPKEGSKDIF
jgi:hypothetical protein